MLDGPRAGVDHGQTDPESPALNTRPPRPRPAPSGTEPAPRPRSPRRLLPLLIACLGLLAPAGASHAAAGATAAHPGPHACVCGMNCKGSCCCARRAARSGAPTTPAPATPAALRTRTATDPDPAPETGGGPCLASAPCGGLPATPAPSPRLQGRVLVATPPAPRLQPPIPGSLARADGPRLRPAATPEPADDPPEPAPR